MRVLIIDNIDSFVYNLVQYVGMLGGNPTVLQNNKSIDRVRELIEEDGISHIVISPGPKTPSDAGISNQIIEEFGSDIPILGVCLGHQCIGYVYGAEIVPAKTLMHGKTSIIKHDGNSILKDVENPLIATRYHSLVVDRCSIPSCLKVTAESMDDNEIMGLRHMEYPVYGLQFHPESILTKDGLKIIKNFLEYGK